MHTAYHLDRVACYVRECINIQNTNRKIDETLEKIEGIDKEIADLEQELQDTFGEDFPNFQASLRFLIRYASDKPTMESLQNAEVEVFHTLDEAFVFLKERALLLSMKDEAVLGIVAADKWGT